jgi:hypothetical protein
MGFFSSSFKIPAYCPKIGHDFAVTSVPIFEKCGIKLI